MWKADLGRAYRQLRADPLDAPLLGMKVGNNIYIDLCPPFGCRSSAAICQKMANALVYIMKKKGYHILAYLDDFGACFTSEQTAKEFPSFSATYKETRPHPSGRKICPTDPPVGLARVYS